MDIIVNNIINNLTYNLDTSNIPHELDLVISGGAFNGTYAVGILMYIKKLEELNKIKIKRISGASVGSIVGLAYLLNRLNKFNDISNEIIHLFKTKYNLYDVKEKLMNVLNIMDKNDYKKLNNKLYITYFDIIKKKQIIVKKYKNNKHVIETVFKSSYIPFLMDGNISYNGKIDGGYPYIFERKYNRKILFINLLSLNHIKGVLCLKNENNSYIRVLKGVLDIHNFFKKEKHTCLCSYVDNWDLSDYISFRSKEYILFIILFIIDILDKLNKKIPKSIKKSEYYLWFKRISFNIYKDMFDKLIN